MTQAYRCFKSWVRRPPNSALWSDNKENPVRGSTNPRVTQNSGTHILC